MYSDGIVDLKRTIFLFLALLFASAALSIFFLAIGITDLQKVSVEISNLQQNTPLLLGYLLIVRVAVEEFFFRGFLTKKIGALYSSIAFAILHVGYGSIAEIAGAFVLGFILAKAFEKNKTLLPNIFAHMLYNLSALLLIG